MNPLSLRCRNYRTFPDLNLELPDGCSAIVGPNGAGKSSIVNAVELALFGGRLADHLTDTGDVDELMVELTFEHRGELYRVRRGYSARGRGKTTVDFERAELGVGGVYEINGQQVPIFEGPWFPLTLEAAKATQSKIEEIVGFTRDTWRASSFLAQGDGAAFTEADPRDRKRILAEAVLGRDPIWPRLLDAARTDKRTTETRISEIAGALERADLDLARLGAVEQNMREQTSAEAKANETLGFAEKRLEEITERFRAVEGLIAARRTAEAQLEEARARAGALAQVEASAADAAEGLPAVDARIVELDDFVERGVEIDQANRKLIIAREVWQKRIAERQTQLDQADRVEKEIARLRAEAQILGARSGELGRKASALRDEDGQPCDRCGQALVDEALERAAVSYLEEARGLDEQALALLEQADTLPDPIVVRQRAVDPGDEPPVAQEVPDEVRDAPGELGAIRERKAALELRIAAGQEPVFRRQLEEARGALSEAEKALELLLPVDQAAVEQIQAEGLTARGAVNDARASRDTAAADRVRVQTDLDRLHTLAGQTKTDREERDALLRDVDQLAVFERAYGQNGVPATIIENAAIPQIEAEANRILAELGGVATHLQLRTQRALKSGDGLADTLDVVVYTDTGERDYSTLSGGERSRVNVALRIALARLLASRRGAESELLVLDEVEFLDEEGQTRLAEVLRGLAGDFKKIILVSHVPGLRDVFETVIEVVKEDGHSRVVGDVVEVVAA